MDKILFSYQICSFISSRDDKLIVYDLVKKRVGWADYNCKFKLISGYIYCLSFEIINEFKIRGGD
jgi:hypothetical protein